MGGWGGGLQSIGLIGESVAAAAFSTVLCVCVGGGKRGGGGGGGEGVCGVVLQMCVFVCHSVDVSV